jgi:hypothetical protein
VVFVSNAEQRVRLKTVAVREIFAYVRAIFDASVKVDRLKPPPYQLRDSLARLESVRLRPVEEFASSSAILFRIIDLSAVHVVVEVAIGVGQGIHGLIPCTVCEGVRPWRRHKMHVCIVWTLICFDQ